MVWCALWCGRCGRSGIPFGVHQYRRPDQPVLHKRGKRTAYFKSVHFVSSINIWLTTWTPCVHARHLFAAVILRSMHAADNAAMIGTREDGGDRSRDTKFTHTKMKQQRRSGRSSGRRGMAADGLISRKEFPLFMEYVTTPSS